MQARPIRTPSAAVLYTDPTGGTQGRKVFENIMCQRLKRLGISASFVLASLEEEVSVAGSLQHLLRLEATFILIVSTTATAGPGDVVGREMLRAGCRIERFLAPVEPSTLLLLDYKDDIPIVSAPGCFRSTLPNVADLVRLSKWDVASLGQGGLPVKKAMRAVASHSAGWRNRRARPWPRTNGMGFGAALARSDPACELSYSYHRLPALDTSLFMAIAKRSRHEPSWC
jgi:hypothetical protein